MGYVTRNGRPIRTYNNHLFVIKLKYYPIKPDPNLTCIVAQIEIFLNTSKTELCSMRTKNKAGANRSTFILMDTAKLIKTKLKKLNFEC